VTTCTGTSDNDPACVGITPYCEKDFKFCITCESGEGSCAAGTFCDVATGSTTVGLCVGCSTGGSLCPTTQRCDYITGRCVACVKSADCSATTGTVCNPVTNTCVQAIPGQ
jgi:hypothetical protein